MLLHIHHLNNDTEQPEAYVLHVAPVEARALADAVYAALGREPDAESYSITLGLKSDLDREPEPIIEIIENSLIVPGAANSVEIDNSEHTHQPSYRGNE